MWWNKNNDDHNVYEHEISRLRTKLGNAENRLDYMEARIRGIQQHGKSNGKGEVMYNVQGAKGRYVKCYLPEIGE